MREYLLAWAIVVASTAAVHCQNKIHPTSQKVSFHLSPGKPTLAIRIGGQPFAVYVYNDKKITRPYLAHVHVPGGIQITRNHPPKKGDLQDHATYHPGIWMAFGDISGNDYWRLNAKIVRVGQLYRMKFKDGRYGFNVQHAYYSSDGKTKICDEICQIKIVPTTAGYLLMWFSLFKSERGDFYFGDQEEMGLGIRMATPIAVNQKKGGKIVNSDGKVNERQVWGKQAKWCDYSGVIKGTKAGATIIPHPKNFRASWFHARDYGLLLANPFGRKAFTRGKASKVVVKKGESLLLRFGIFLHSNATGVEYDPDDAYQFYLKLAGK